MCIRVAEINLFYFPFLPKRHVIVGFVAWYHVYWISVHKIYMHYQLWTTGSLLLSPISSSLPPAVALSCTFIPIHTVKTITCRCPSVLSELVRCAEVFYNSNSHCVLPTAVPQTTVSAWVTLFNGCQISLCGLCLVRPSYLKHCRNIWNNRDAQFLYSNFLSTSVFDASLLVIVFCVRQHLLLFFSLYFLFFALLVFLYLSPPIFMPRMLSHSIFHAGSGYPHCGELCLFHMGVETVLILPA